MKLEDLQDSIPVCPICGNKPKFGLRLDPYYGSIRCESCGFGTDTLPWEDALDQWNKILKELLVND